MAKPIKNFGNRKNASSEPISLENFRKVLKALIENPSDESHERLNSIRLRFIHSTRVTEGICRQMRGLTRKLRSPGEEELQVIMALISSSRKLSKNSELLVRDYEIFREEGVIVLEIEDFKKACKRLREAINYIESVYLSLPGGFWAEDLVRRN